MKVEIVEDKKIHVGVKVMIGSPSCREVRPNQRVFREFPKNWIAEDDVWILVRKLYKHT